MSKVKKKKRKCDISFQDTRETFINNRTYDNLTFKKKKTRLFLQKHHSYL